MNVLFVSPHFPAEMPHFTRGLAEVGARVYGVAEAAPEEIPEAVWRYLSGYVRVRNLGDIAGCASDIRAALGLGNVAWDRIECLWEPHVILAAGLRETFGVPGMSVDTVRAYRDKALMKERISAAGLRVPKNRRALTESEVRQAAQEIGFPLVIKPIAGAGTADTYGVHSAAELDEVLGRVRHVPEVSVEEYIEGDELTYDAVVINGEPAFESVAQYFPKPLESRNLEWISPAQIVYRDPHLPEFAGGIALGRGVLKALDMGTGFVHMEWFRKPDGEVVFGEIACRAGGAKLVDQMNFANDFDVYREWARSVCWQSFEATPHRRYHVAVVFKRAMGQGRITGVAGLGELRNACGASLIGVDLLPIGQVRRNWKQTLLSDGYVTIRHPDLARCRELMSVAISKLRLYAE